MVAMLVQQTVVNGHFLGYAMTDYRFSDPTTP